MANRSDFFTTKFPRKFKKIMAMGEALGYIKNNNERGLYKRAMIEAHANHVGFKMKRSDTSSRDQTEEV
jgi:hypothetical protein